MIPMPSELCNLMLGRSMAREKFTDDSDKRLAPKLAVSERTAQEERHRETMVMLDRIATALEQGNRLTEEVVQNTV